MMRPGIEPGSPGTLANTLPTRPMSRFKVIINYRNNQLLHHLVYNTQSISSISMGLLLTQLTEGMEFMALSKQSFDFFSFE